MLNMFFTILLIAYYNTLMAGSPLCLKLSKTMSGFSTVS
jgi:hypothetical protein